MDESKLFVGGYKSKLGVAKHLVQDYKTVLEDTKRESELRGLYLKKCYNAFCLAWTHIQKLTHTPLLDGVFPAGAVDTTLISTGTPELYAENLIKVALMLVQGVRILKDRESDLTCEVGELKESIADAITIEPTNIPSPLLRSYDLLTKALEDMADTPPPSPDTGTLMSKMDSSPQVKTDDDFSRSSSPAVGGDLAGVIDLGHIPRQSPDVPKKKAKDRKEDSSRKGHKRG